MVGEIMLIFVWATNNLSMSSTRSSTSTRSSSSTRSLSLTRCHHPLSQANTSFSQMADVVKGIATLNSKILTMTEAYENDPVEHMVRSTPLWHTLNES